MQKRPQQVMGGCVDGSSGLSSFFIDIETKTIKLTVRICEYLLDKDLRNHVVDALGKRHGHVEGEARIEEGGLEQEGLLFGLLFKVTYNEMGESWGLAPS